MTKGFRGFPWGPNFRPPDEKGETKIGTDGFNSEAISQGHVLTVLTKLGECRNLEPTYAKLAAVLLNRRTMDCGVGFSNVPSSRYTFSTQLLVFAPDLLDRSTHLLESAAGATKIGGFL